MDGPRSAAEVELVVEALTHGDLEVVGQITDSSNIALLCEVQGDAVTEAAAAAGARDLQAGPRRTAAVGLPGRDAGRARGRDLRRGAGRGLGRRPADRAPR